MVVEPGILQGGKVAPGHEGEPPDPRLVRDPTQFMPETDVGKFLSQDLLDSAVGCLSLTDVRGSPTADQQTIHLGVPIETPIGPKRGKRIRVEDILVIVGIGDADVNIRTVVLAARELRGYGPSLRSRSSNSR